MILQTKLLLYSTALMIALTKPNANTSLQAAETSPVITVGQGMSIEDAMQDPEVSMEEDSTIESIAGKTYPQEELDLLARLVEAEAGDQDLMGRRLVVDVVLNRVDSPKYPNSISGVIFQKGQFAVVKRGQVRLRGGVSQTSIDAVAIETSGERVDSGILYFATWRANGKGFWKHGDHWFSY